MFSGTLQYSIWNPTGNITALVESSVSIPSQPGTAAEIMKLHPEVEQVGFVRFHDAAGTPERTRKENGNSQKNLPEEAVNAELRMAGGEFCGNASMCAAALYLSRLEKESGQIQTDEAWKSVLLRVSGAEEPVEVRIRREVSGKYRTGVLMPPAQTWKKERLEFEGTGEYLPVVRMEGISHIIIGPESAFFSLLYRREDAERAIRSWSRILSPDGLGMMFLTRTDPEETCKEAGSDRDGCAGNEDCRLTPLVHIPESATTFWENSCASGTAAAGIYLASKTGCPVDLSFREPGGCLRAVSDPGTGKTWLYGTAEPEYT